MLHVAGCIMQEWILKGTIRKRRFLKCDICCSPSWNALKRSDYHYRSLSMLTYRYCSVECWSKTEDNLFCCLAYQVMVALSSRILPSTANQCWSFVPTFAQFCLHGSMSTDEVTCVKPFRARDIRVSAIYGSSRHALGNPSQYAFM